MLRRGTVPDALGALTQLQWLLVDGNHLSGPLPAFLGQLPNLKQARLQDNSFAGPVPSAWCSNGAAYELERNPLLCGESSLKGARLALAGAAALVRSQGPHSLPLLFQSLQAPCPAAWCRAAGLAASTAHT